MKRKIEEILKTTTWTESITDAINQAKQYDEDAATIISRIIETARSIESSIESNGWTDAYAKVIIDMAFQLERVLDVPRHGAQSENAKDGLF